MSRLVIGIVLLICFAVALLWIAINPEAFSVPLVIIIFHLLFVPGIVLAYLGARRINLFKTLGLPILEQLKKTGRIVPAQIANETGHDEAKVRAVIDVMIRLGAIPPDAEVR